MLSYAQAEAILAHLHGADAEVQKGAFRGRLKHLKRLGIPLGSNPGRGQKIQYSIEHLCQWAFCLELEQMGLDPSLISQIVHHNWDWIFEDAFSAGDLRKVCNSFFYLEPKFMTSVWDNTKSGAFNEITEMGVATVDALAELLRGKLKSGRISIIDVELLCKTLIKEIVALENGWAQASGH